MKLVRRHGRPETILYFYGGIGDQLMCSAVGRELQRRRPRRIWFFTQSPELFADNPDFQAVLPFATGRDESERADQTPQAAAGDKFDLSLVPWARLSRTSVHQLFYQGYVDGEDRDVPLTEPCIAALCRRAGLTGEVSLRPYLPRIKRVGRWPAERPRIVVHSSCLNARYPIANKQWPVECWQSVVTELSKTADVIQLGSPQDPRLAGAIDRRGGPLLSAASELADCDLFVGMVGFLMHLARAVDCPAVIVYGGREPPEITGYSCNQNLAHRPPCAPCWAYSRCDHERICLTAITPAMVLESVQIQLSASPLRPLPADRFLLAAT